MYNILRVSSGWQRCPPAQRLAGKAQGCFTPQQRASSEEAAGQRAAGTPQQQVRTHGAASLVFFSGLHQADRLNVIFFLLCQQHEKSSFFELSE